MGTHSVLASDSVPPGGLFRCVTLGNPLDPQRPWALGMGIAMAVHVALFVALLQLKAPARHVSRAPPELVFFAALPPPPATGAWGALPQRAALPRRQARPRVMTLPKAISTHPKPPPAPVLEAGNIEDAPTLSTPELMPASSVLPAGVSTAGSGVVGGIVGGLPGSSGDGVQDLMSVREPPRLLKQVLPHYSEAARIGHVEGTVRVRVVIGVDGNVETARVVHSVPLLDEAALNAIRRWRFSAAVSNAGAPVRVWVDIPVRFFIG